MAKDKQNEQRKDKSVYIVKGLQFRNGQRIEDVIPYEIARFTRKKEAKGQTRHQRNSKGDLLLEKFAAYYFIFEYEEPSEDYYIFRISTIEGLEYEAHIFLEEENVDG